MNNPQLKLTEYYSLLLKFQRLPRTKRNRTFMEVAGYPHFENVCSNILRFYFDPTEEHGLKDLLLSAFLRMAGHPDTTIPPKVSALREQGTVEGKRIDLVIESESFTIGIENKINHWLANPLDSYSRYIDGLGKKQIIIKAVLSLHPLSASELTDGFKSYTYRDLWTIVRSMLGDYICHANPKWVTCLLDFIENTTNQSGQNMEQKETDQFFIKNDEALTDLASARDEFLERLNQQVAALKELMSQTTEFASLRQLWVWQKSVLVMDFRSEDHYSISLDLSISPTGWQLQLLGRNNPSRIYLGKLIHELPLRVLVGETPERADDRFNVQSWDDPYIDLAVIQEALRAWIRAVTEAARAIQAGPSDP